MSTFDVKEDLIGLYEYNRNTGEHIYNIIKDVLIRTGLPLSNLRSKTYDGAANISEKFKGITIYNSIKSRKPINYYYKLIKYILYKYTVGILFKS